MALPNEEIISKKAQEMFDLVDWFEQICLDPAYNDISTLNRNYGQLSALAVLQARKMRVISKDFRENHANRRIRCAIRQTELQESNDPATGKTYTATKAESVALKENQDVYYAEYKNQGEWEGSEIVLRQVNQVLYAMDKMVRELSGVYNNNTRTEHDNS